MTAKIIKTWAKNLNKYFSNKYMKRYSTSLITREIQIKTKLDTTLHLLGWLLFKPTKT